MAQEWKPMDLPNMSPESVVREYITPPAELIPCFSSRKRQATDYQAEVWPQDTKRWRNEYQMKKENLEYIEPQIQQYQNEYIEQSWNMPQQKQYLHEVSQQDFLMQQYQNGWVDNSWNCQQQPQQKTSQELPMLNQQQYEQPQYNQFYEIPPQIDQAQVVQYQHNQHQHYQQMHQQQTHQTYDYIQTPPQVDTPLSNNSTPNLGIESLTATTSEVSTSNLKNESLTATSSDVSTSDLRNQSLTERASDASTIFKINVKEKKNRTLAEETKIQLRALMVERQFREWLSRRTMRHLNQNVPNWDMSKDNEVLEMVGGRLAIVGNMTKYSLTAGELRRRIEGAESINISQLNCLFRKAKKKNGGEEIRRKLWHTYGIDMRNQQRNVILQSRFTSILEEEARALATDVDIITSYHFPRNTIARMVFELMKKTGSCPLKLQKLMTSVMNTLNRIMEIISQCRPQTVGDIGCRTGYEPLDDKMEFFSNRCHGFEIINMNTWFRETYHIFQTIQRNIDIDIDVARASYSTPMAQNHF